MKKQIYVYAPEGAEIFSTADISENKPTPEEIKYQYEKNYKSCYKITVQLLKVKKDKE